MAPPWLDSFTDYSKTQRIVLLIDLNPILHLPDPSPYISAILSASKSILAFPPLSSSLFSFKPFFSSLSPLLSSSKLPSSATSRSFDYSDPALQSVTDFLSSLPDLIKKVTIPLNPCRASCLAASMRQTLHDYVWDPVNLDSGTGNLLNCDGSGLIRSNLVVLFSPICKDLNSLRDFLDVDQNDDCLSNIGAFKDRFCGFFQSLSDAYVGRDIHCCWVDVKCEFGKTGDSELEFGDFKCGIESLNWGFCSTDLIILGAAFVPFGLIYPKIGVSLKSYSCSAKRTRAQLSLEILDVNGKPLECKCSELEFSDFMAENRQDGFLLPPELASPLDRGNERRKRSLVEQFSDGITKLHVKEVRKFDKLDEIEGSLSYPVIVKEFVDDSVSDPKGNSTEFYADRVLQMLATEMDEAFSRKPLAAWQIFLSSLYRDGYFAIVSFSDSKGDLKRGVLKPYTVSSAFLSVIDDFHHSVEEDSDGANSIPSITRKENKSSWSVVHSVTDHLDVVCGGQGKKKKMSSRFLHNLTWSTFCQAASECWDIKLEEAYFARGSNISKKLKFLKCWMKQIKKGDIGILKIEENSMPNQDVEEETHRRSFELPQESEQLSLPIEKPFLPQESEQQVSISGSVGDVSSRKLDEAANENCSGTSEDFFSSLPDRIQQALESNELDLAAIAERLVRSSIFWLNQKHRMEDTLETQTDECDRKVAVELAELLLKEPKNLAALHKKRSLTSQASDPGPSGPASVDITREYELQILIRMEILQSELGTSIEEQLLTQKFVKQICSLLDSIQCHLEGGFFGDWRLDDYVERFIKRRYYHTLPDVVDRIYMKMDLLLFDGDGEDELLGYKNSEDSNQSQRKNQGKIKKDENLRVREPVLAAEGGSGSRLLKKRDKRSLQESKTEDRASKLLEVQKKRERARRCSYFTSSMPDLQRVWAPKHQQKGMKPKTDPQKPSKRKDCDRESYDTVCETPITDRKRSCFVGNSIDDEDCEVSGTPSYGSVSKALFQDDSE